MIRTIRTLDHSGLCINPTRPVYLNSHIYYVRIIYKQSVSGSLVSGLSSNILFAHRKKQTYIVLKKEKHAVWRSRTKDPKKIRFQVLIIIINNMWIRSRPKYLIGTFFFFFFSLIFFQSPPQNPINSKLAIAAQTTSTQQQKLARISSLTSIVSSSSYSSSTSFFTKH